MTEERLVLAELLEKAGDGDFLRNRGVGRPKIEKRNKISNSS
jgi:hypothetical protein